MKLPSRRKSSLQLRPATAKPSTSSATPSESSPHLFPMPKRSHSQLTLRQSDMGAAPGSSGDAHDDSRPSKEPMLSDPRVQGAEYTNESEPPRRSLYRRASNAASGAVRQSKNFFSHHRSSTVGKATVVPESSERNDTVAREMGSDTPMHPCGSTAPSTTRTTRQQAKSNRLRVFENLKTMGRRGATSGASGEEARWNPRPIPATPHSVESSRAVATLSKLDADESIYSGTTKVTFDCESAVYMHACDSMTSLTISKQQQQQPATDIQGKDFTLVFPTELVLEVFSLLDMASLTRAEAVSKAWNHFANDQGVWQRVFQAQYEPRIHVSPAPIQMGGHGAGQIQPGQDWKLMAAARRTIETRWKVGRPAATYFNGHTDSVYCCQFDEHKIITGSRDRTIRVWDIETGRCTRVIGGGAALPVAPTQTQMNLNVEPTNTICNLPSLNGTPDGRAIFHTPKDFHDQSILCLQYDDELMVTGSSDTTCIVWNVKTFEPIGRLRRHNAGVLDVCLDAKHIISCSKDATICVWDRQTHELKKVLYGHKGPVNAVQLRGNLLVSASGDGVAKLWNLESGNCVKEYASQDRGLAAVEFSDDAKYVLAGGNDQVVYKFDAATGEHVHTYKGHGGLVRSLFVDAPNNVVVSGSYDQSIRVYDYTTGDVWGEYKNWTTSWILSAKSDYRRIVCTSQDGRSVLMDFGNDVPGVELLKSRIATSSRR